MTPTPLVPLKTSILIVEDEASLRGALRDKFTREGFLVHEAKDGEAGLALALLKQPELILLDMMMPKMDGISMLHKLRVQNEWSKKVPVLIFTNMGGDEKTLLREVFKDEAAEYLVKSDWPINKLVQRVREAIASTQ